MSFLRRNAAALVLLLVAVSFLVIGVYREEMELVFRKAIQICMECIGLG